VFARPFAGVCAWPSWAAVYYNDLYSFSPAANKWTPIAALGAPAPRHMHGLAATPDGMLFVFGGFTMDSFVNNQITGSNARRGGGGLLGVGEKRRTCTCAGQGGTLRARALSCPSPLEDSEAGRRSAAEQSRPAGLVASCWTSRVLLD
jgi:hypothetical protein